MGAMLHVLDAFQVLTLLEIAVLPITGPGSPQGGGDVWRDGLRLRPRPGGGGYAAGEVSFVSQALGFRHSHLDAGGYSYDQKRNEKDVARAVEFLVQDEKARVFLTSMVACLFAREVYKAAVLSECLSAVGYRNLAENVDTLARRVQKMRLQIRMKTGFDPASVKIPRRFTQVVTWKGPLDTSYLDSLQKTYAKRIREMATVEERGCS